MSIVWTEVALLVFLSILILALMVAFRRQEKINVRALSIHLVVGSVAVGLVYLFVFAWIQLRPSPWNLVWFIAIPGTVALLRRPRLPNLSLTVPLMLGGWLSFALIAWTLQIPVD